MVNVSSNVLAWNGTRKYVYHILNKNYSYSVFMNFLKLKRFGYTDLQWRDRSLSGSQASIKNIFICISKMNKSLKGLSEQMMTELKF